MYVHWFRFFTLSQTKILLFFFSAFQKKRLKTLQKRMETKDAGRVLKMLTSVADPGCLSRIPVLIFFHPGSRIQQQQKRRGKISFNLFL
jgi:hypothetical protein